MSTLNNLGISIGLLIMRLSLGGLMLMHGVSKAFNGLDAIKDIVVKSGFPEWSSYGVFIGEILAPICIIFGLVTRVFSAILALNCLFAVYMVHMQDFFALSPTGGWALELLGLYFFMSVGLIFTGGGKIALTNGSVWN